MESDDGKNGGGEFNDLDIRIQELLHLYGPFPELTRDVLQRYDGRVLQFMLTRTTAHREHLEEAIEMVNRAIEEKLSEPDEP